MSFETLNWFLSLGTIFIQVATLALLVSYLLRNKVPLCRAVVNLIGKWGFLKAGALAFMASALALYYSDVLGFIPCGHCWIQRVFLFPQVFILLLAWWRNDKNIALYSIVLSTLGAIDALYQHYIQMGGSSLLPCPASGAGDCAQRIIFEFGYITFPLMAFSAFAYMIVVMLCVRAQTE